MERILSINNIQSLLSLKSDLAGLDNGVIIPKSSRDVYGHAVLMVGLKTVEVDSVQEREARIGFSAALAMVPGNCFDRVRVSLDDPVPVAKEHRVPVLVNAAADSLAVSS